jgi:hypothetical protein
VARKKSRVGRFLILLLLLGGGWLARDTIAGWLGGAKIGVGSVPSERLARTAENKVERLLRNGLNGPVRFSEAEIQSLLSYRASPWLPAGIEDPRVDVQDSVIIVSARVRPAELRDVSAPDVLRTMLADSSRVIAVLLPSVDRPGRLSVSLRSLQIGGFVVPAFMLPMIVEGLAFEGFQASGGAILAALPGEVGAVRIEGDDVLIEPTAPRE